MAKMYGYNTAATQIKKRYANNGTTAVQVKKRYAHNGTTAKLVYSAEETLYPNGGYTPQSNSDKMNGGSASGFKITLSGTYNTNANRYIGTIDSSKYKSITIKYTVSGIDGTASYPAIALTTKTDFWAVYACNTDSPGTDIVSTGCHKRIKTNGSGTISFDVTNISTKVYVWAGLWENTEGSGGGTIEITEVIAEPA